MKFSFTLISINQTKYNIFQKSGYFVTISKTTICLMHQNYQFLFGKVAKFSFKYQEVSRMRIRIWI